MTRAEMIATIRRARALAQSVYGATDLPQIQLILRHADQNLHWALWNLGQVDGLRPDLPGSVTASTPKGKAKPSPRSKAASADTSGRGRRQRRKQPPR